MVEKVYEVLYTQIKRHICQEFEILDKMMEKNPEFSMLIRSNKDTLGLIVGEIAFNEENHFLLDEKKMLDDSDFQEKWDILAKTYYKTTEDI